MSGAGQSIEERAASWLASNETCEASLALCNHMLGKPVSRSECLRGVTDLNRCLELLDLVPEWKPRIREMGLYGAAWKKMAAHWHHLTRLFMREAGLGFSHGHRAPRANNMIKELVWEAENGA